MPAAPPVLPWRASCEALPRPANSAPTNALRAQRASTRTRYRRPNLSLSAAEDTTPFIRLNIPGDVSLGTFGDQATLELRSEWQPPGAQRSFPAGTLLAAPLSDVLHDDWSRAMPLFEPAPDGSSSLASMSATFNYMVLQTTEHVRTRLRFWRHQGDGAWLETTAASTAPGGSDGLAPAGESVSVSAIWPDDSDDVFVSTSGFLHPSTLAKASAVDGARQREALKALPAMFDASRFSCVQHFATSADGTRVPYFLLGPRDLAANLDGSHPTLLDGCELPHPK